MEMLKLWNVALTIFLLGVAYVATIALSYDGYCYGFTDGQTPCSFARHFEDNYGWSTLFFAYFFPHVFVIGFVVYLVNDAIYRAVVALRLRKGKFPRF